MSEISVEELQARLRAAADTTDEQSLIVQSCAAIEALQAERDALAAKLREQEGQEPVNTRLVEALKNTIDLLWVEDSHSVEFDGTVMFGPYYDFSGIDGCRRSEFRDDGIEFVVWPAGGAGRKWSAYSTYEGSLWFEKFDSEAKARAVCMKLLADVMPEHAVSKAMVAIAAAEAKQTEPIDGRVIDRAWARFCGAFGDGPDAPYPGMIAAFETHYGQSFRDREWRTESACWAAAWHRATEHAAKQTEPVRLTGDQLEGLVKWYGEEPNIYLDRREYARTIQEEVLRANGFKVEG